MKTVFIGGKEYEVGARIVRPHPEETAVLEGNRQAVKENDRLWVRLIWVAPAAGGVAATMSHFLLEGGSSWSADMLFGLMVALAAFLLLLICGFVRWGSLHQKESSYEKEVAARHGVDDDEGYRVI